MNQNRISLGNRPLIFEARSISEFILATLQWRKHSEPDFSIRKTAKISGCSPSLVTLVAQGKRELTRKKTKSFGKLLLLSRRETRFLEDWVTHSRKPSPQPRPQNHLLADWLNIYVKDASGLEGFEPQPDQLSLKLGGIASPTHIEKSLKFLIREGFIRRTLDGKWVKGEPLTTTTDGIPNSKIRNFHKQALKIAAQSIDHYPPDKRRASAVVLSLNLASLSELQELLKEFYDKLLAFTAQHSGEKENLYQVLINLTPIGGQREDQK